MSYGDSRNWQAMELVKGVHEKYSQLKVIFHETVKVHYTHLKKVDESPFLQSTSIDFSKKHLNDVEVLFCFFQVHTTIS
jgi:hypothetical protein